MKTKSLLRHLTESHLDQMFLHMEYGQGEVAVPVKDIALVLEHFVLQKFPVTPEMVGRILTDKGYKKQQRKVQCYFLNKAL